MEITTEVWGHMTGRITEQQVKADLELHEFCGLQWYWPFRLAEDFAERIRVGNGYSKAPQFSCRDHINAAMYGMPERG